MPRLYVQVLVLYGVPDLSLSARLQAWSVDQIEGQFLAGKHGERGVAGRSALFPIKAN